MKSKAALLIGAGAFGTSIATLLAQNFTKVFVKVRSRDTYQSLKTGKNEIYFPDLVDEVFPDNITPILNWDQLTIEDMEHVELIVFGLPTSAISSFCTSHQELIETFLERGLPFISLAKGIDSETLELPDDIFFKTFSEYKDQFTFLSGPSFAQEIIQDQITLVSLAGRSRETLEICSKMITTDHFKVFPTYDVKGVLLGGALKNVIAIAAGILEELGFNQNTRAAMITRGIREILRFGIVFNARPETFYGLSGMGDIILTSTSDLSRNKTFGRQVARGEDPKEIIERERSVVEGYKTAKAAFKVVQKYQISATMITGVYYILYEGMDPKKLITELLNRPIPFEI